jgi:Flp pilus assembly protein TadD
VSEDRSAGRELLDAGLQDAVRLADSEDWDAAFSLLQKLEGDHPHDATLLCMLAVTAGQVEARGLAYDYFRRCLAEQPTDPAVLVPLGAGLARYDDPDAEGVLRLAAVTAPDLPAARLHYGAYLAREGIFDLAITELRAACELDPGSAIPSRELGIALFLAGDLCGAIEELDRAAGVGPEDADTRLLYGMALAVGGRLEEAAEELHRAASELVEDGEAQMVAALACATQGWSDEAWDALARAEGATFPPDALLLGEAEDAIGADEAAASALLLETVIPAVLHERLQERP